MITPGNKLISQAWIHGPLSTGTDRSECVRDLHFFDLGPVRNIQNFDGPFSDPGFLECNWTQSESVLDFKKFVGPGSKFLIFRSWTN